MITTRPCLRTGHRLLARAIVASAAVLLVDAGGGPRVAAEDVQVNTTTSGRQRDPRIAMENTGAFVIVWSDIEAHDIRGQRFDANGATVGTEFTVADVLGIAYDTDVATDEGGDFVVVWDDWDNDLQIEVEAARYSAEGPEGPAFSVNTYSYGDQLGPVVGMDDTGDFVVAWETDASPGDPQGAIQAQRFAASGLFLGDEFQVHTYTANPQGNVALAVADGMGFVATWVSVGSPGSDNSGLSIQARVFDSGGAPVGDQFQVNTFTTGTQSNPAITVNAEGTFVVVWMSVGSTGSDTSGWSVQARRFVAGGVPAGPEFQVNTTTTDDQTAPSVAVDAAGDFVVVWASDSTPAAPDEDGILGQRFAVNGLPVGGEFQVNSISTTGQSVPRVAIDDAGTFVVTWMSGSSLGTDSSDTSIQMSLPASIGRVFVDGFEAGDTSAWSSAVS